MANGLNNQIFALILSSYQFIKYLNEYYSSLDRSRALASPPPGCTGPSWSTSSSQCGPPRV